MTTPSVNTSFLPKTNLLKTFAERLVARINKGRVFGLGAVVVDPTPEPSPEPSPEPTPEPTPEPSPEGGDGGTADGGGDGETP